jgi:hypothetical protein
MVVVVLVWKMQHTSDLTQRLPPFRPPRICRIMSMLPERFRLFSLNWTLLLGAIV